MPDRDGYKHLTEEFRKCLTWQACELKSEDVIFDREGGINYPVLLSHRNNDGNNYDLYGILIPSEKKYNSGKIIVPIGVNDTEFSNAHSLELQGAMCRYRPAYYLNEMAEHNSRYVDKFTFEEQKLVGQFEISKKDLFTLNVAIKAPCLVFDLNGDSEIFMDQQIYKWQEIDRVNNIPPNEVLAEGVTQEFVATFPEFKIEGLDRMPGYWNWNQYKEEHQANASS